MFLLPDDLSFPDADSAQNGIVAFGGDLSAERLKLAYTNGIFPWYEDGELITWWSPEWRMVLVPEQFVVSKSMRNIISRNIFEVTFDKCFRDVVVNCRDIKRDGQHGTWITDEMTEAYCELHRLGMARSVEVWQDGELVGGLYGVDLGEVFCGESMFSKVSNASKVAFVALVKQLQANRYKLLDCQVYNEHLESLGAREISRREFLQILKSKV